MPHRGTIPGIFQVKFLPFDCNMSLEQIFKNNSKRVFGTKK